MNTRSRRLRGAAAVLAGLAAAATVAVAAPAASAQQAGTQGKVTHGSVVLDRPAKGGAGGGGVTANDWTW